MLFFLLSDSVVFTHKQGEWLPELGDYLGQLTDEVDPGDYIVAFVTGGPKQYAFRTAKGKEVCKLRGFTLNSMNSSIVHFEALKDYICNIRPQRNTTLVNPTKICRDKANFQIISKPEAKHYYPVYKKRIIVDNYYTLPYGY